MDKLSPHMIPETLTAMGIDPDAVEYVGISYKDFNFTFSVMKKMDPDTVMVEIVKRGLRG